ncbi:MAG: response regulator transcription factor [Cyanobacteria bacterium SZAS LIN-5]|nr:response regulator transcription factor [Cyanobacteria bacterium SZAS LIN-5]RTL34487.1 MAG: response regulator transcription factor [Candidatus Melainabacteria bacterium]
MPKILLADDDVQLCNIIRGWLLQDNHNVEMVHTGLDAIERLKISEYDLVVLDITMPLMDGMQVLSDFRASGGTTPILMLTGQDSIQDKERGFDAGADDYLTKPFHGKELTARIRALLRRPPAYTGNVLTFANLKLDKNNYAVLVDSNKVSLLPKEFDLLEFFMRNPNRVFAPETILTRVWAADSEATVEAVTTCIKRLRKKIDVEGTPSLINTIRGAGYKLEFLEDS